MIFVLGDLLEDTIDHTFIFCPNYPLIQLDHGF